MFQSTPPRGGRHRAAAASTDIGTGFNPRPRVGGDRSVGGDDHVHGLVSIHAPAWGATWIAGTCHGSITEFQSTPPRGGRLDHRHGPAWHDRFQSTPPRGGRRTSIGDSVWRQVFQSTPPRGGRPCVLVEIRNVASVSIHAPAWGATDHGHGLRERHQTVSIHAPAWGATMPGLPCRLS